MSIYIIQGAILYHEFRRSLGPYLGNPRNIIGRIAHQRLQFNKLYRSYLIRVLHIFCIIILDFRLSALGFGNPDFYMVTGNLKKIPVTRYQGNLHPILFPLLRQGSQDIIRLKTCLFHGTNSHSLQHFLDNRHLLPQLLGHGLSCPLILLIKLMPEGRRMYIKCHRQEFRLFFLQYFKHNIQEAIYRIGMKPLRITQIRHTIERSVQYAVPVNQNHFFTHINTTVVITRITISMAITSK